LSTTRNSLDFDLFKILSMPALLKLVLTTCALADVGQGVREVIRRHKETNVSKASVNHADAVIASIFNLSKVNVLFLPELDSSYQTDVSLPICHELINSYNEVQRTTNPFNLMNHGNMESACEGMSSFFTAATKALQADQELECAAWLENIVTNLQMACGDESSWPSPFFEKCVSPFRRFLDVFIPMARDCQVVDDSRACTVQDSYCPIASVRSTARALIEGANSNECSPVYAQGMAGIVYAQHAETMEAECDAATGA